MKVKSIRLVTDLDTLHKVSEEVDLSNTNLVKSLESELLNAYNKLDGKLQGLSAIQVDRPYRAILLRYVKGGTPIVVYNPKVISRLFSKKSNEGCMSEPEHRYIVRRPMLALVEYYLSSGEKVKEWLPYAKARIFCHEVDHCNGVLLQDKGKVI